MSLYSTIGQDGIIIDLSQFASIQHDKNHHQATLNGGIAAKTVAVEVAKDGFCTSEATTESALPPQIVLTK